MKNIESTVVLIPFISMTYKTTKIMEGGGGGIGDEKGQLQYANDSTRGE